MTLAWKVCVTVGACSAVPIEGCVEGDFLYYGPINANTI